MSPLKFKALPGGDVYAVRRDGALLGTVERVEVMTSVVSARKARLSVLIRWNFRVDGQRLTRGPYLTRQKAAEALAGQYDAHQRAKAVTP